MNVRQLKEHLESINEDLEVLVPQTACCAEADYEQAELAGAATVEEFSYGFNRMRKPVKAVLTPRDKSYRSYRNVFVVQ